MLSSMSPSFVESQRRIAVLGTPGGSRIITMVLHAILDFYQGASAEHMVNLPRFHHQYLPDQVFYEGAALDEATIHALEKMGHKLKLTDDFGNMHVVVVDKQSGRAEAASDHRGIGASHVLKRAVP